MNLLEGERLDDLQNGYWMIQNNQGFCYGIDAVLLSAFAKVKPGEDVLDLCTGTGIVPLLLKAKTSGRHFTGLEIQEKKRGYGKEKRGIQPSGKSDYDHTGRCKAGGEVVWCSIL